MSRLVVVAAIVTVVAWWRHRLPLHARFSGSGEMADADEINAFWTDERLENAQPMEMPTVDPAYEAQLEALHRWLPWHPEAQTYALHRWVPWRSAERISHFARGGVAVGRCGWEWAAADDR